MPKIHKKKKRKRKKEKKERKKKKGKGKIEKKKSKKEKSSPCICVLRDTLCLTPVMGCAHRMVIVHVVLRQNTSCQRRLRGLTTTSAVLWHMWMVKHKEKKRWKKGIIFVHYFPCVDRGGEHVKNMSRPSKRWYEKLGFSKPFKTQCCG